MIPLLIGMAVSRAADAQAEQRREKLRQAMRAYQRGQSQIGQRAIEDMLQQQTPAARGAELDKITADRAGSLRSTVASVQPSNPTQIAGKLSPDYVKSQEASANTVAERTRRAIEQLSAMGAPGEQGLQSGIRYGRTAGTVDSSNSAIGSVGNAYMGDINNTVANPGLKLAGSALMAYGGAKMGQPAAVGGAEQLSGPGAYDWEQPDQLSGPGYEAPVSTSAKVRRAMSLLGRKSN